MRNFLVDFPDIDPDGTPDTALKATRASNQGISVASYNLGCFLGAVITIWIGNPLGRRRMIMLGTAIMVVGAILQASATTLPHFIVGRIITGIGNGGNTSTVPTWQSETSRSHKRGKLVMIEGALITCGIMISYWIDLGFSFLDGSIAWRFPLAFQLVFCIFILALIWYVLSWWGAVCRVTDSVSGIYPSLRDGSFSRNERTRLSMCLLHLPTRL